MAELAALTLTDEERYMAQMAFKSRRQAFEESFHYRLAYHGRKINPCWILGRPNPSPSTRG